MFVVLEVLRGGRWGASMRLEVFGFRFSVFSAFRGGLAFLRLAEVTHRATVLIIENRKPKTENRKPKTANLPAPSWTS
jgi:hypothetical protein